MDTVITSAISFSLSQVLLSVILLCRQKNWSIQQRFYAALLIAISGYLLMPVLQNTAIGIITDPLATAVPGLFWLFSASLFDDHFKLQRWQILLVASTLLLPILGRLWVANGPIIEFLLFSLPLYLEFLMLTLALVAVLRFWHVDLIESRRSLRLWFCGIGGLFIFVLILFREVVIPDAGWLSPLQYLPVAMVLLAINALLLEYKYAVFARYASGPLADKNASPASTNTTTTTDVEKPPTDKVINIDPALMAKLLKVMEQEHAYREMGLTIGQLAEQLSTPQYRLRQVINSGLGHRNFNDFLNSYRIAEASRRLADSQQRSLPILTIALDTGFRSLSSFNKAFKATYNITPTTFRSNHHQQLENSKPNKA